MLGIPASWAFDHDGAAHTAQCIIEHKSFRKQRRTTGERQGVGLLFPGCRSGVWEETWHDWLVTRQLRTQH